MFFRQIFDVRAARGLDVLNIDSQKYNKVLKIISAICVAVMACIQLFLLFTHISEPTSDAKQYVDLAKNAYENGVWYPSKLNVHDTYLFGNGLVNILILVSGYLIRLIYGSAITDIPVSNWLYLTVMAFSFYMGLGKRRGELGGSGGTTRKVLKFYNRSFLDKNMYMTLGLV